MKISLRILFFSLMITSASYGQKTEWQIGLFSFFDNNEFGHSDFQIPQTMAGVRLSPGFGLRLDSVHSINVGVSMLHEFGSSKALGDFSPTAFYQYDRKPFRFIMGAFPRSDALERYPRLFFQDSVSYYRPNLKGILLEFTARRFMANVWLDWTSRQSPETRETFLLGYMGRYTHGILYAQQFFYMFHFAGVSDPLVQEALHDNLLFLTSAGIDFSGRTSFDILDINGGWALGLERARSDNTGWIPLNGFLSEARVEYKRVGIFNTYYSGRSLMHFYEEHGNDLYWGDPFYRANSYNRTDFYIDFIRNDVIRTRFIYSLHFTEKTMYHEQALKVSFNLNSFRLNR
ncbi:MAG: hypothetical protein IQL11_01625 [Bacteroidales bacterium]|nr:hypothetical protein [Bacteroidales bacterium]